MKRPFSKRWCLLPLAGAILTWLTGCGLFSDSSSNPSNQRRQIDKRPSFTLTAEELAREYADHRHLCDSKYKGKYLQIEGTIYRATPDPQGQPKVDLLGVIDGQQVPPLHVEVSCKFAPKDQEKARDLSRGQKITLLGICDGQSNLMWIEFIDCEIVKVEPDPSIAVTAAELTREYARNKEEADKKYLGQQLLIEGVFLEVIPEVQSVVVLQGDDEKAARPLRVGVTFDQKTDLSKLKKGETIKIKGECTGRYDNRVSILYAVLVK